MQDQSCPQMWRGGSLADVADSFSLTFEFEAGLQLSPLDRLVRWNGIVFGLTEFEYLALEQILTSNSLVSTDQQMMDTVWFEGQVSNVLPKTAADDLFYRVRKKFLRVDPTFNRLRTAKGMGYYWSTREIVAVQFGPLRVAKEIPLMWWNGIPFEGLTPSSHQVVLKLIWSRGKPLHKDFLLENPASLAMIIGLLNRALEPIVGGRLIVSARREADGGFVYLNPKLFAGPPKF